MVLCNAVVLYAILTHSVVGNGWWILFMIPGSIILFLVFAAAISDDRREDGY